MTDTVDDEWDFALGVKHIHMRSGRRRNDLELSTGDDFCRMHCHSHNTDLQWFFSKTSVLSRDETGVYQMNDLQIKSPMAT